MEKIIQDIKNKIVLKLRNEPALLSLTLVGSFANPSKKIEAFNDLDFVIIIKELTSNFLGKIEKISEAIEKEFSRIDIGVTHTTKIGPVKIKSKKKTTIMLHFLIYPERYYEEYESPLTRFSFQSYPTLAGLALSKISKIDSIKKEHLFNESDGIPASKRWLTTERGEFITPSPKGMIIGSFDLKGNDLLETTIYSVLRLASNMLRLKGKILDIDEKMCREFEKKYPIKSKYLPFELLKLKKEVRQGKNIPEIQIKKLKAEAIEFINECEEALS